MISIVICSINPLLCDEVVDNIKNTIGITHEIIVFDNRDKNWGIGRVYNHCARKAIYPFLCFVHEDIILQSQDWGPILTEFASKTKLCGVIGFAGGTYVPRNFVTWGRLHRSRKRERIFQRYKNGNVELIELNPCHESFSQTITVDGFFLFVKKTLWQEIPFDEQRFDAFHFYDADFSLAISQQYHNYITYLIDIQHLSIGSLNQSYCTAIVSFRNKWQALLPYSLYPLHSIPRLKEELNSASFTVDLYKSKNYPFSDIYAMLRSSNSIGFLMLLLCYRLFMKLR